MDVLGHYINLFRRWWWVLALCTLLGTAGAYVLSSRMTPIYRASSLVLVDHAEDPTSPDYQDVLASQKLVDTYADRMSSRAILQATAAELGLRTDQLASSVRVVPVLNTSLIRITVDSPIPQRAMDVANRLPAVFVAHNESLQRAQFAEISSRLMGQLDSIAGDIKNTQAKINELGRTPGPDNQATLERLTAELSSYRANYANLLERYGDLRLAEARAASSVVLDQAASMPSSPVAPNVSKNTLLGGIAGLALALSLVILLGYLDDRVRTGNDLVFALQGVQSDAPRRAPQLAGSENMVVVGDNGSTGVAAFQVLRPHLSAPGSGSQGTAILIAAPVYTSDNATLHVSGSLAESTARSGYRVAVIDADQQHPRLHQYFGAANDAGFVHALSTIMAPGDERLERLMIPIGPRLDLMPVGSGATDESVDPASFQLLLRTLRERYDVVIVRVGGLLHNIESAVLAAAADGIMLAVEAGHSRRGDVAEALAHLSRMRSPLLGTVLTRRGSSMFVDQSGNSAHSSTAESGRVMDQRVHPDELKGMAG